MNKRAFAIFVIIAWVVIASPWLVIYPNYEGLIVGSFNSAGVLTIFLSWALVGRKLRILRSTFDLAFAYTAASISVALLLQNTYVGARDYRVYGGAVGLVLELIGLLSPAAAAETLLARSQGSFVALLCVVGLGGVGYWFLGKLFEKYVLSPQPRAQNPEPRTN